MKHRIFAFFLALSLLLSAIPALATETTEPAAPAPNRHVLPTLSPVMRTFPA